MTAQRRHRAALVEALLSHARRASRLAEEAAARAHDEFARARVFEAEANRLCALATQGLTLLVEERAAVELEQDRHRDATRRISGGGTN